MAIDFAFRSCPVHCGMLGSVLPFRRFLAHSGQNQGEKVSFYAMKKIEFKTVDSVSNCCPCVFEADIF